MCEARLEMRERRPPQERFQDHVHAALVSEHKILTGARAEIDALSKKAEKSHAELKAVQLRLAKGAARREANIKRAATKPKLKSSLSLPMLVKAPSEPPSPSNAAAPTSPSNAPQSPKYAPLSPSMTRLTENPDERALSGVSIQDLIKLARERAKSALSMSEKCADALHKNSEQCDKATANVVASLEKRRTENIALKEQLTSQHKEVTQTVLAAEELIARLKMAQMVAASPTNRNEAPPSEAEQKAAEEKWAELQSTEAALVELKTAKGLIEDDIRRKTAAMKIDESCKILRAVGVDARPPEERDAFRMPRSMSVPSSPADKLTGGLSSSVAASS